MYVRITTIRGDGAKVDAAIDYIEESARPAVEATSGSRGFATFVDREAGPTVGASYWDSADSLRSSEGTLADAREGAASAGGGTASFESYELAVGKRMSVPGAGAPVRMARFEIDPGRVDEGITFYRDEVLPELSSTAGLCSTQLLIDRESGRGIAVSAWEDDAAVSGAQSVLEQARARGTERAGIRFTGIETYTMVRTSVQLG